MLYILLPFPMVRSLQLLFRPGDGKYSDSLTAAPGISPASSVYLSSNPLDFGRTTSVTLFGHSAPSPLESALTKIAPITRLESAVSKTKDLKPFRIRSYGKTRGKGGKVLTKLLPKPRTVLLVTAALLCVSSAFAQSPSPSE